MIKAWWLIVDYYTLSGNVNNNDKPVGCTLLAVYTVANVKDFCVLNYAIFYMTVSVFW